MTSVFTYQIDYIEFKGINTSAGSRCVLRPPPVRTQIHESQLLPLTPLHPAFQRTSSSEGGEVASVLCLRTADRPGIL
jgi:hypothetical protein